MSSNAPGTAAYPPQWSNDLFNLHQGRVARQFVLHFNITDVVIDMNQMGLDDTTSPPRPVRTGDIVGEPLAFRDYLYQLLRRRFRCEHLFTYSLAAGLNVDEDSEQQQQQQQQFGQRNLSEQG